MHMCHLGGCRGRRRRRRLVRCTRRLVQLAAAAQLLDALLQRLQHGAWTAPTPSEAASRRRWLCNLAAGSGWRGAGTADESQVRLGRSWSVRVRFSQPQPPHKSNAAAERAAGRPGVRFRLCAPICTTSDLPLSLGASTRAPGSPRPAAEAALRLPGSWSCRAALHGCAEPPRHRSNPLSRDRAARQPAAAPQAGGGSTAERSWETMTAAQPPPWAPAKQQLVTTYHVEVLAGEEPADTLPLANGAAATDGRAAAEQAAAQAAAAVEDDETMLDEPQEEKHMRCTRCGCWAGWRTAAHGCVCSAMLVRACAACGGGCSDHAKSIHSALHHDCTHSKLIPLPSQRGQGESRGRACKAGRPQGSGGDVEPGHQWRPRQPRPVSILKSKT